MKQEAHYQYEAIKKAISNTDIPDIKHKSVSELRGLAIKWLKQNGETKMDDTSLNALMPLYNTNRNWEGYLNYLEQGNHFDYLTLYAIAYACNLQIVVVTSILSEAFTFSINSSSKRKIEIAHWHKMCYCAIKPIENNLSLQPSDGTCNAKVLGSEVGLSHTSLKNYNVIPNYGITFEFSEEIKIPYSIHELSNGDRILSLEIPGSEPPTVVIDAQNKMLMKIFGTKLDVVGVIQSTRKTGAWVFNFEIPDGWRFEDSQDSVGYDDGICDVLLKKGNPENVKIVVRKKRLGVSDNH